MLEGLLGADAFWIAPRLILALALGMAIGAERQIRQRQTGLNTHALVALGAAAFTALAALREQSSDLRLAGQVVSGIGFLGAGLILRDGVNVRGLASAATVWATGSIGVLAGYGYPWQAVEVAAFVLLVNVTAPKLARVLDRHVPEPEDAERFYVIKLTCDARDEALVRAMLLRAIRSQKVRLHSIESHSVKELGRVEVEAGLYSARDEATTIEKLVGELSLSPMIFSASWTDVEPA